MRRWLPAVLIALAIIVVELVVFRATPAAIASVPDAVGRFVVSPGFGGAMALAAAAVAYRGVVRKLESDEKEARAARRSASRIAAKSLTQSTRISSKARTHEAELAKQARIHAAELAARSHEDALEAARVAHEATLDRQRLEAENDRWWQIVDWLAHGQLAGAEVEWIEILTDAQTTNAQDMMIDALVAMIELRRS
ncbi:hypothetical protein DVB87_19590 [Tsukamurella tyrosinosolvens]|nr:hypothetical protein DVB87_19590 [Tsukamurella tyrosinosolvens]